MTRSAAPRATAGAATPSGGPYTIQGTAANFSGRRWRRRRWPRPALACALGTTHRADRCRCGRQLPRAYQQARRWRSPSSSTPSSAATETTSTGSSCASHQRHRLRRRHRSSTTPRRTSAARSRCPASDHPANTFIRFRAQVSGASPTTLASRAWADGTTEPTTWKYSQTDSNASLQAAGVLGLRTYISSATTNAPVASASTTTA